MDSVRIRALNELAVRALAGQWSAETRLFHDRVLPDAAGGLKPARGGNTRYTAMSLIGLHHAERAGYALAAPAAHLAAAYLDRLPDMEMDELALAFWVNALYQERPLGDLLARLDAAEGWIDGPYARGMVLAWLLRGLIECQAVEAGPDLARRAAQVKDALLALFVPGTGLFRTARRLERRRSPGRAMREYKTASFASQIYPVYALAGYHRVLGGDDALQAALACGKTLVNRQGAKGQWWWIYHPDSGTVVEKYPVYAVHQDGMAPMGLFELAAASGISFDAAIDRGLDWIYGDNELGESLIDEARGVVWRAIQRAEPGGQRGFGMGAAGHLNMNLASWLGGANLQWLHDRVLGLEMLRESRSYHMGWILTAYADKG